MTYHAKLIKGGKVVIPAELRRELGFADGDTLVIVREGNAAVIKTHAEIVREMQAEVKKLIGPYKGSIVDQFIAEKRAEALAEDRGA